MRYKFQFSYISSFYFSLLVLAYFHSYSSNTKSDAMLCMDDERQALLQFKHGLIDDANLLASWDHEKNNDCCKWGGIVCDNTTSHVNGIHIPGNCHDFVKQLRGDLSPSLMSLQQLSHLDLSCNDFGRIEIPKFIGSLRNLKYLNLSYSNFGGIIPPQFGNLTDLHILCVGSSYDILNEDALFISISSMRWLSSLHSLYHLDMSGVDLSKAIDWFQVINTLPSLVKLQFSNCQLSFIDPHFATFNLTSLSLLDLSNNDFSNSLVPWWIFSITGLVSLDLTSCGFRGPIPSSTNGFHNLTSLKFLHVSGNNFMSSSLALKGLSSVGSNLILLDISSCGVSSSVVDSLHNLTSLLSLDLSDNQLTKTIPKLLGNHCNLRHLDLASSKFHNTSLTSVLESFFECKSPKLESLSVVFSGLSSHLPYQLGQLINLVELQLGSNRISGTIPESVGELPLLRSLDLNRNLISGPVPYSIGGLSSLELLDLSYNQLNGSLPDSLGQLSKLKTLYISYNLLTGVVTETHFSKLTELKALNAEGNNLTLRPRLANWTPSFRLQLLVLNSWNLGPQFPVWLELQRDLLMLGIVNTRISSTVPEPFWRSLPKILWLDMSQNQIEGRLILIPASIQILNLNSNKFSGVLPKLSNGSVAYTLDLSNNSFVGSLNHFICSYGVESLEILNLEDNNLSGLIPTCWNKWPNLTFLNLQNNNLSGGIPHTLGSLSSLGSLNLCNNKLSGRLPISLKKLMNLQVLQVAKNELFGSIPSWVGTELPNLGVLNLRSNNFDGNIPREICYLTSIQILDLAHNNLSGNIPRCFNNFSVMSMKENSTIGEQWYSEFDISEVLGSVILVTKGHEYTYSTIIELVMILDLSSNNLSGSIPSELMNLHALQSLNLSGNQLTGRISENIGDLKSLESLDVSLNQLSGELPVSLSRLSFLSSFNVSFNSLTGRIPLSRQLQGFNKSSFLGNKLCGVPLTQRCGEVAPSRGDEEDGDGSHEADWGLISSILLGFVVGFWIVVTPLMVKTIRKTSSFSFLSKLRYMFLCC